MLEITMTTDSKILPVGVNKLEMQNRLHVPTGRKQTGVRSDNMISILLIQKNRKLPLIKHQANALFS